MNGCSNRSPLSSHERWTGGGSVPSGLFDIRPPSPSSRCPGSPPSMSATPSVDAPGGGIGGGCATSPLPPPRRKLEASGGAIPRLTGAGGGDAKNCRDCSDDSIEPASGADTTAVALGRVLTGDNASMPAMLSSSLVALCARDAICEPCSVQNGAGRTNTAPVCGPTSCICRCLSACNWRAYNWRRCCASSRRRSASAARLCFNPSIWRRSAVTSISKPCCLTHAPCVPSFGEPATTNKVDVPRLSVGGAPVQRQAVGLAVQPTTH